MIKLMIPDMPTADELLPYLRRIDEAKTYSNRGPLVTMLEDLLSQIIGAPCVTVTNCTVALELALRSLDLPQEALVSAPAFTFAATGRAIESAGLLLDLRDVDSTTWQLATPDPLVTLDAVVPVAPFGEPVDQTAWFKYTRSSEVPVVIDAAGALLSQDLAPGVDAVFSLHATKFIGAGEGGVFASVDPQRVEAVRKLTMFGEGGTNGKLSEYHAAVALASLGRDRLNRKLTETKRVANEYTAHFPDMRVRLDSTIAPLLLPEGSTAAGMVLALQAFGIEAKQWYQPFLDEHGWPHLLPMTEQLRQRLIGLPFHTQLSNDDVQRVCSTLRNLMEMV